MPSPAVVVAHWHTLFDDFATSSLDWYTAVEQNIAKRDMPAIRIERIERGESGIGSAKRTYLRVTRGKFMFDICAAPHGRDFFFSWWLVAESPKYALLYGCLGLVAFLIAAVVAITALGFLKGILALAVVAALASTALQNAIQTGAQHIEDIMLAIPIWGDLYARWWRPATYYATDTRLMFQESVHRAVLETIEGITTVKGLRALSPEERRPTMRDLLG